jgi:hypothetical protein
MTLLTHHTPAATTAAAAAACVASWFAVKVLQALHLFSLSVFRTSHQPISTCC